ncbi:hypothetical protein L6Q96_16865 [Candidatus Binatia bacterium]|nr:hypothetical protein [Candidatus Binatia bacterium]
MLPCTTKSSFHALKVALVAVCLFGTTACSGGWFASPTPTPTTQPTSTRTMTPTLAPRASDTPTPAPTAPPTPDAAATATVSARRAACEGAVAVLSGREKDSAALDRAEVLAMAVQAPDLVMCGAVVTDDPARCTRLMPEDRGPGGACRALVSIFHELRTYPGRNSFLITEDDGRELAQVSAPPAGVWDAVRKAVRSGDARECAAAGDLASICRAFIELDAKRCRVEGKLADLRVVAPKTEGKPKLGTLIEDFCKENIKTRAFLAKGLADVAESGPPRERELARAALGRAGACGAHAENAVQVCMGGAAVAAAGTTAAPVKPAAGAGGPAPGAAGGPAAPGSATGTTPSRAP